MNELADGERFHAFAVKVKKAFKKKYKPDEYIVMPREWIVEDVLLLAWEEFKHHE